MLILKIVSEIEMGAIIAFKSSVITGMQTCTFNLHSYHSLCNGNQFILMPLGWQSRNKVKERKSKDRRLPKAVAIESNASTFWLKF